MILSNKTNFRSNINNKLKINMFLLKKWLTLTLTLPLNKVINSISNNINKSILWYKININNFNIYKKNININIYNILSWKISKVNKNQVCQLGSEIPLPIHPYHIVDQSPWPLALSGVLLSLTISAVLSFHGYVMGDFLLTCSLILLMWGMGLWFKDIITEASYLGFHTDKVQKGISLGVVLFIISEVFFFLSIFWAYFHSSLAPAIEIGGEWPPKGVEPVDASLRRCSYFNRLLTNIIDKYSLLNNLLIDHKSNGLTRVVLANELGLQGLGISKNHTKSNSLLMFVTLMSYCMILRSACSVIISSLTRVNCYFKTGSSTRVLSLVSVTLKYKRQRDNWSVRVGSIRSSRPEQARTRNVIQDLIRIKILNDEIINTGNLGQIYKVIKVKFMKIIKFYSLIKLYNHFINKLSIRTIRISRPNGQDTIYWYGGKIIEKAKASSNFDDSLSKKDLFEINNCYLLKSSASQKYKFSKRKILQSRRQNSILFIRFHNLNPNSTRSYTQVAYKEDQEIPNKEREIITWKHNWKMITENVRKKQVKLAETAGKFGKYSIRVVKLQEALALSLEFRLLAVFNVANNKGSKTPGLDGIILNDDQSKSKMVEELKSVLIKNQDVAYRSGLIKRVYIPKSNGKLRPLGIPNIKDRCLQELLRLILDPVVEPYSDKHSYGFRKYRSAKNAIGAIRVALHSGDNKNNKYILDADIKGFFDHINHTWLLDNVPLSKYHKRILQSWLKAGIISKGYKEKELIYPDEGTPQGGIISPLLGNFTLNGLENVVIDSIRSITKHKLQLKKIKKRNGSRSTIGLGVKCIRYADDFVILARNKRILTHYVKPTIENFLRERGLTLSEEKTKIFGIQKESLDFLGYRFKYQDRWKKCYSFFKNKIGQSGIALFPQKSKLLSLVAKIKEIIQKSSNDHAFTLITKLNPIIRGWCNYYNLGESSYYRNKLRYYLFKLCWKWAKKKHPKWGKKRIAQVYFLRGSENSLAPLPFKGRKWNFRGRTFSNSRYNYSKEGKYIYLIDPTVVVSTVSAIRFLIPEKIININAFDINYLKLIEFQIGTNIMSLGKEESFKGRLYKKQNGYCEICKKPLLVDTFLKAGNLHIDHIRPISEGGSRSNISNMRLLHIWCHKIVHRERQSIS